MLSKKPETVVAIPAFEKNRYDFLHVDKAGNLHCFIPLVGCTDNIGTDNTCETSKLLKKTFAIGAAYTGKPPAMLSELMNYSKDLIMDLEYFNVKVNFNPEAIQKLDENNPNPIVAGKIKRLKQAVVYYEIIQKINDADLYQALSTGSGSFPTPVKKSLNHKETKTNCVGARLNPTAKRIDTVLRIDHPLFSLETELIRNEQNQEVKNPKFTNGLIFALRNAFQQANIVKAIEDNKSQVLTEEILQANIREAYKAKTKKELATIDNEKEIDVLREVIKNEIEKIPSLLPKPKDEKEKTEKLECIKDCQTSVYEEHFKKKEKEREADNAILLKKVDQNIRIVFETEEEVLEQNFEYTYNALLSVDQQRALVSCKISPFHEKKTHPLKVPDVSPPFNHNYIDLIQIFLALANIYYYEEKGIDVNFGYIIEHTHDLKDEIASVIVKTILTNGDLEANLIGFIENKVLPQAKTSPTSFFTFKKEKEKTIPGFSENLRNKIRKEFRKKYETLCTGDQPMPHLDEFMAIVRSQQKPFFVHFQNTICLHLSEYCNHHPETRSYFYPTIFTKKNSILPNLETINLAEDGINLPAFNTIENKAHEVDTYEEIVSCLKNHATEQNQFRASLLLSKATQILLQETGIKDKNKDRVFKLFNGEQIRIIKELPSWNTLLPQILSTLQKKSKSDQESFQAQWYKKPYLYVNKENEDAIYAECGLNYDLRELIDLPRNEKLQKALKFLGINIELSAIKKAEDGGYIINFSREDEVEKINGIFEKSKNYMHLTQKMAGSLYSKVCKDPQYKITENELNQLNNNWLYEGKKENEGAKIIVTLKKLFPDLKIKIVKDGKFEKVEPDAIQIDFNKFRGYIINGSTENLNRIRDIHHANCTYPLSTRQAKQLLTFALQNEDKDKSAQLLKKLDFLTVENIELALSTIGTIIYDSIQAEGDDYRITCEEEYYKKLMLRISGLPPYPKIKKPGEMGVTKEDMEEIYDLIVSRNFEGAKKKIKDKPDLLLEAFEGENFAKDIQGCTPIHAALKLANPRINSKSKDIKELINFCRALVDEPDIAHLESMDNFKNSLLYNTIYYRYICLKESKSPREKDANYFEEFGFSLLDKDPNADGKTNEAGVNVYGKKVSDPNSKNVFDANNSFRDSYNVHRLFEGIRRGNLTTVDMLIKLYPNIINKINKNEKMTALQFAMKLRHEENEPTKKESYDKIARHLIGKDASLDGLSTIPNVRGDDESIALDDEKQNLEKELEDYKQQVKTLSEMNQSLFNTNKESTKLLIGLKKENNELKSKNDKLQKELTENTQLSMTKMESINNENIDLYLKNSTLMNENDLLKQKLAAQEEQLKLIQKQKTQSQEQNVQQEHNVQNVIDKNKKSSDMPDEEDSPEVLKQELLLKVKQNDKLFSEIQQLQIKLTNFEQEKIAAIKNIEAEKLEEIKSLEATNELLKQDIETIKQTQANAINDALAQQAQANQLAIQQNNILIQQEERQKRDVVYNSAITSLCGEWGYICREQSLFNKISTNIIPNAFRTLMNSQSTQIERNVALQTIINKIDNDWLMRSKTKLGSKDVKKEVIRFREQVSLALVFGLYKDMPNLSQTIQPLRTGLANFLEKLLCTDVHVTDYMKHHSHLDKVRKFLKRHIMSGTNQERVGPDGIRGYVNRLDVYEVFALYATIQNKLDHGNLTSSRSTTANPIGSLFFEKYSYTGSGRDPAVDLLYQAAGNASLSAFAKMMDATQVPGPNSLTPILTNMNNMAQRMHGIILSLTNNNQPAALDLTRQSFT